MRSNFNSATKSLRHKVSRRMDLILMSHSLKIKKYDLIVLKDLIEKGLENAKSIYGVFYFNKGYFM